MMGIRYGSRALLAMRTPVWRSKFIVALLALAFAGLIGRAAYVQVFDNEFFQKQGTARFTRTLELPAGRGRILDRNGLLLASSVEAFDIWADPEDVERDSEKLVELARLLEMKEAELRAKLADESKNFVWLRRQVDVPVAREIAALDIAGVHQDKSYKRRYPEGEALAHVVGFTGIGDKGQEKGLEGVELAFEKQLAGRPGSRRVIKDRLGRVVESVGDAVLPVDGKDVQLSIDSKVQFFAYQRLREAVRAHKARAGSVVVLDAHSGEVLALANYPSYSPDDRSRLKGAQLRNTALTDEFEPGSTMKPITVAMALEAKKVTPRTVINTAPGFIQIDRFTVRDTHNYGALTVEGVIQKSSNVGSLKIARMLTPKQMWETYDALGYGKRPKLSFPGAATGRVRPWKSWRPVEQATMSYGYGLSASLFQIAHSYTACSNDGRVIDASLLKVPDGQQARGVQVFSPENARAVRRMLKLAVGQGGTGQRAQTEGYSVGGKSGTARKQVGKGYSTSRYRAWFTGIAPIEHPRVVVAVMIDEPSAGTYYGGAVAAPVFSQVVQHTLRTLGVPPDLAVKNEIVAAAAGAQQ